jgi:cytochrome P450
VGNQFALMEGKLILAALAARFRFRLTQAGSVGYDAAITLRPKGGLPMRVEERIQRRVTEKDTEAAQRVLA